MKIRILRGSPTRANGPRLWSVEVDGVVVATYVRLRLARSHALRLQVEGRP